MVANTSLRKYLYLFIILLTISRLIIASSIELGNDEVYYWTYALFPDWSHFDHPPMVGWLIQLFSLNLLFSDEIFLRLGPIVISAINTFLVFVLAKKVWNEKTAFISAILYNSSIYFSVIAGIFIMPDAPQVFFWLLSIYFFVRILIHEGNESFNWIFLGITIGLSTLSKYHSIYLWVAIIAYYIIYERNRLPYFKILYAGIITLIVISPIIYWNVQNDFISFTFHGNRVNPESFRIRFDYFFSELFGQFFYQNPINFILIVLTLITIYKNKFYKRKEIGLFLLFGLPVILIFLSISFFRRTLPHWSGPGFLSLLFITSYFIAISNKAFVPKIVQFAGYFQLVILIAAVLQINLGVFLNKEVNEFPQKQSASDLTLELFGWNIIGEKFNEFIESNNEYAGLNLITYKWFPAAHIDYYISQKSGNDLIVLGDLKDIHKYHWINKERKQLNIGDKALYLTFSHNYKQPQDRVLYFFKEYVLVKKIPVERNGKIVKYCFVYLMKDYKGNFTI